MSQTICASCGKPKANLQCGLCAEAVCKSCVQFVEPERVSLLDPLPADLSHGVYCETCFGATVLPLLEEYDSNVEKARQIFIFFKGDWKDVRSAKRGRESLKVVDCLDREEAILKLAFMATRAGFNAIVELDVTSRKVRVNGYQSSLWSAGGVPAHVDAVRHNRP